MPLTLSQQKQKKGSWVISGLEQGATLAKVRVEDPVDYVITEEDVWIDPNKGPVYTDCWDRKTCMMRHGGGSQIYQWNFGHNTPWYDMTVTEREVQLITCAKKNKLARDFRAEKEKIGRVNWGDMESVFHAGWYVPGNPKYG